MTAALATAIPGLIHACYAAYLVPEPDVKVGREGTFYLLLVVYFLQTICNTAAFTSTAPLYYWLGLPRTRLRVILHSLAGTLLASASFHLGLPRHMNDLLPHQFLSNFSIFKIIVATFMVAIIPFLLVTVLHKAFTHARLQKSATSAD